MRLGPSLIEAETLGLYLTTSTITRLNIESKRVYDSADQPQLPPKSTDSEM